MKLRPYQSQCLKAMSDARARGVTRQLIVMATGVGKTFTVAAHHAAMKSPKLFGLMHREELLKQAKKTFLDIDPNMSVGIEKAEQAAAPDDQVILASVQTVGRSDSKRLRTIARDWPGIFWIDETHHAAAGSYLSVLDYFGLYGEHPSNRQTTVIGTTATPERLDHLGYDKVFDDVVFRYGLREAIRDKWLADIHAWRITSDLDLSGVHTSHGDFVVDALDKVINTKEHNRAVVDIWREHNSADMFAHRSLFFCVTKNHAHALAAALNDAGANAAVVVDDTPKAEREGAIEALRAGTINILVNVGVFTEGFDLPEVESIHIVRPTQSQALYTQMVGRGTRRAPGKDHMRLFDHTGQTHDVCSIGRIFGLPDAWAFGGQSVTEDADELEEATKALGLPIDGLASVKDLKQKLSSSVSRMQLIKHSLVAADIPSSYVWIRPSQMEERYLIGWRNETEKELNRTRMEYQVEATDPLEKGNLWGISERLEIWRNELGRYEAKLFRTKGDKTAEHSMGSNASLAKMVGQVEGWMEDKRPHKTKMLDRKAKWSRQDATSKQLDILRRKGVAKDFLGDAGLTKREASILMGLPASRIQSLFR